MLLVKLSCLGTLPGWLESLCLVVYFGSVRSESYCSICRSVMGQKPSAVSQIVT